MNTQYLKTLPEQWQPTTRTLAAIGDKVRQHMLLLFEPGESLTIKQITSAIGLSRSAVVHHLNVLQQAGILHARKKGKEVFLRVNPQPVAHAIQQLNSYMQDYLGYETQTEHD